ncbi:MAG: DUF2075 domain-containing protein [Eubacteriales bacterium]|nr:DUF2075 domain-containing protein [Eubacteriales bacterium]
MIVYTATRQSFMDDTDRDVLVDKICTGFRDRLGRPHQAEVRAWQNSLGYMYRVLNDRELPADAGVAIEFRLPGTSRRIDFVLSGLDAQQKAAVVIIELKQWEMANAVQGVDGMVETIVGGGLHPVTHPSYQAWSYAAFLKDYNVAVQEQPVSLYPCAYLHNYRRVEQDALLSPQYAFYTEQAPPFMRGEIPALRAFIKRTIRYGDQRQTLYTMDQSQIRPSKSLQDMLVSLLKGNQEFILIDSQKLVYDTALLLAQQAKRERRKAVLVVEGGPGTGKSVVAINLLVKMTQWEMLVHYVTKNAAPRHVYEAKLTGSFQKGRISNLFHTSGAYVDAPANSLDVLVVDEAHRLTDRSGLFRNLGEDQVKEIIEAAWFSVFFIDESQRVTTSDFGSIDKIVAFAGQAQAAVTRMRLDSQFRCNGSDGYVAWLDDVLDIHPATQDTSFRDQYDFRVLDDPAELRDLVFHRNQERNKARLLAGYCWDWPKDRRSNPDHADIDLSPHDFRMSWNLDNTSTWAIDPESVRQVGCIHTSQGLEFDYVGVIIGHDLRFENGGVITDLTRRAATDQSLKGIKKKLKENPEAALALADEIIKNTYRTLMTRGMKGCYVYCCDRALGEYLKERFRLMPEQSR